MSRGGTADRRRQASPGGLVQEFVDHWVALSGDAWLALGGADDVRRALAEAANALVPDRGPGSPRRVVVWSTDELALLDLPGLLTSQGFEFWEPTDSPAAGGAQDPGAVAKRTRYEAAASDLGITTCAWAAAETGTIALYATPSTGRLPSLLPTVLKCSARTRIRS